MKTKSYYGADLAQRYAQCGRALKARHADPALLRVNAAKFNTQCTALAIADIGNKTATPAPICAHRM